MLRFDHVVLAVSDLDDAARRLQKDHGLASVPGGRHLAWGTGNRIVPLGESYIELLGVVDAETAAGSSFGRAIQSFLEDGDRLLLWCVATDLLEEIASRLEVEVTAGSRVLPDGREVQWRSAGLEGALTDRSLPFFIRWEVPPELHPGRMRAEHAVQPAGIAWVEVGGPEDALRDWLGDDRSLPIRVTGGGAGVSAVGIATRGGDEIVLR